MKKAFVFPGQGAQYVGMGKELYDQSEVARTLFKKANQVLGFDITEVMFHGSDEDLKQTRVTQPAVFLHSYICAKVHAKDYPDMVAGHSLGEFSALAIAEVLSFDDALRLVSKRAGAMQKACERTPSTMAAIIGLSNEEVESLCRDIADEVVVAANYNCPGQVVISGTVNGIRTACEAAGERGAKRALRLNVGGAFHSPLMEPAREELAEAIESTDFNTPRCIVYQNFDALPHFDAVEIKSNLIKQLTYPVLWTQSVQKMIEDGATQFVEYGPGRVLQGLIRKINNHVEVSDGGE